MIHELHISRNTTVLLSHFGVNCDRDIWGEDATEWKPERWLSPLPASVLDARIPGIYSNMSVAHLGPQGFAVLML